MKKLFALILALAMVLSLAACGKDPAPNMPDGEKVYEFSVASTNPMEAIDTKCLENIISRMSEETNGKVQLKLYPAGQLGDITQIYDEVIAGTIDMALTSVYGTYNILNEAAYLPFLAKDYDDYRKVFAQDGYLFNEISKAEADLGITQLGYIPGGFVGVAYTKTNGTTADDFFNPTAKKNGLIRIPAMEYVTILMNKLNFNTTTMNYSDVYTALQTGTIDGSWHSGPYLNYESFRDVIKYYVDYKAANDIMTFYANTRAFQSMPQEYQNLLSKIVKEELAKGADLVEQQEADCIQKLRDYNITVYEPTDEQRAELRAWVIENVWPSYYEIYGEELMKGLIASLES